MKIQYKPLFYQRHNRYVEILSQYNYMITFKMGHLNIAADYLSRHHRLLQLAIFNWEKQKLNKLPSLGDLVSAACQSRAGSTFGTSGSRVSTSVITTSTTTRSFLYTRLLDPTPKKL